MGWGMGDEGGEGKKEILGYMSGDDYFFCKVEVVLSVDFRPPGGLGIVGESGGRVWGLL